MCGPAQSAFPPGPKVKVQTVSAEFDFLQTPGQRSAKRVQYLLLTVVLQLSCTRDQVRASTKKTGTSLLIIRFTSYISYMYRTIDPHMLLFAFMLSSIREAQCESVATGSSSAVRSASLARVLGTDRWRCSSTGSSSSPARGSAPPWRTAAAATTAAATAPAGVGAGAVAATTTI